MLGLFLVSVGLWLGVKGQGSKGGPSTGLQDGLVGVGQDLVADLGVGDGAMLLPQVETQLALVAEVQVTLLTSVRLLASVNTQVAFQGLQVTEASAAGVTGIRLLPCVNQNMGSQVGHLNESGPAGITVVGLLSGVDAGVRLQVCGPVELGTTYVAAVRLVSCTGGCAGSFYHAQVAGVTEWQAVSLTLNWVLAVMGGLWLQWAGCQTARQDCSFLVGGGLHGGFHRVGWQPWVGNQGWAFILSGSFPWPRLHRWLQCHFHPIRGGDVVKLLPALPRLLLLHRVYGTEGVEDNVLVFLPVAGFGVRVALGFT